MASNIKVGDRAVIIKHPCCGTLFLSVMLVTRINDARVLGSIVRTRCADCGDVRVCSGVLAEDQTVPEHNIYPVTIPIEWLRKLPPLTDADEVLREKEKENV